MLTAGENIRTRKILALLGFIGGIVAIAIGCIFLLFALPSLGRPGELDYFFSQGAGGFLIILLGLVGILAAALAWPSRRAERALLFLGGLFFLIIFVALAALGEWVACVVILVIVAVTGAAMCRRKDAARNLLLFAGLFGFPLTQAAITLLPYGWKTWSVSGVLFLFGGLALSFLGNFSRLPLLSGGRNRKWGLLLYALLSLALIVLTISALAYLPGQAGPGTAGTVATSGQSANSTAGQAELKDCGCNGRSLQNQQDLFSQNGSWKDDMQDSKQDDTQDDKLRAIILSPGDVRTFPHGEPVLFSAQFCGQEPLSYLWRSSLDGIIGRGQSFQTENLSIGWHNITLTVTNASGSLELAYAEIGVAEPWVCGQVNPRPKYYPLDTPCRDIWPAAPEQCQQMEVCHPDLDWIVAEAVDCCDGTPLPGTACSDACNSSGGDRKKCRGLYIINSFGPQAQYMKGYALFKACCSGYPECTRMCSPGLAGTCSFKDGFNENVANLSCRPGEWGVSAWRSDTNMSENSAVMGMFPTHATVNTLQTGVCIDYAAAVTTMLRKSGYSKNEVFSTSSKGYDLPLVGDHPGHAYNLVLVPGETEYHVVDTTGNGDGINLGGVPGYFRFTGCFLGMPSQIRVMDWWVGYCNMISPKSYNDAGYFQTPKQEEICGCS
ncbi:MAG: hypothetical protein JW999_03130 [Methanotrichaceae archaeon]|nr:hypothetical protein [Methanotrichaceae archaeon]